jgi:hypothetical protein
VLAALHERAMPSPHAGDLPMLLAYFIELDPSPELFADLLARCAADPRPGVADGARALQRSWERGLAEAHVAAPPSLSQTLRTLGARLDAASARGAYLAVTPESVRLQTFGEQRIIALGSAELRQQIAAYTALRGQVPAGGGVAVLRHEARLRAVGAALDAEPSQVYELAIMSRAVLVEGSAGYCRVFCSEELDRLVQGAAREQRR